MLPLLSQWLLLSPLCRSFPHFPKPFTLEAQSSVLGPLPFCQDPHSSVSSCSLMPSNTIYTLRAPTCLSRSASPCLLSTSAGDVRRLTWNVFTNINFLTPYLIKRPQIASLAIFPRSVNSSSVFLFAQVPSLELFLTPLSFLHCLSNLSANIIGSSLHRCLASDHVLPPRTPPAEHHHFSPGLSSVFTMCLPASIPVLLCHFQHSP